MFFYTISSEIYPLGNGRQLYPDAIISPYAPAERKAIKSPLFTLFKSTALPNTSDDSQIGPTTSYFSIGSSDVIFSIL